LVGLVAKHRQPFAEILVGQGDFTRDRAGLQIDFAQRGLAIEAGAFVKFALDEDEALGESAAVVRPRVDDVIGIIDGRGRGFGDGGGGRRPGTAGEQRKRKRKREEQAAEG
jgi:hypothetical protein